ncbi:MAG: OmpA family protein [Bdellovibrionia bacterium]
MSLGLERSTSKKQSQVLDHDNPLLSALHSDTEHSEGGEEPWLVTYADLMTLLFGFFAMLFTYASFEDDASIKINKKIAKYFGGSYVSPAQKMSNEVKFEWMKSSKGSDVDATSGGGEMDTKIGEDGMEISFITSVLFNPGRAELLPDAIAPIKTLIQIIQETEKDSQIRIEGHTDDNPISNSAFPSNWELSAARAAALVRVFQEEGFPENQLSLAGYGSSRPAFPNRDDNGQRIDDNQSRNRRVIVKVILPKGKKKNENIEIRDAFSGSGSATPAITSPDSAEKVQHE